MKLGEWAVVAVIAMMIAVGFCWQANLEDATRAKQRFNATSLTVERSQDGDKLLENLRKQNELLAITDDRQRAIATAKQKPVT